MEILELFPLKDYNIYFYNSIIEFYYRISSLGPSSDDSKTKDHTLETVGIWIMQYIQATSTSLKKEMYELLPYLCQFVGNETGQQEVSQTCLKSLCYLSVCITPPNAISSPEKQEKIREIHFTEKISQPALTPRPTVPYLLNSNLSQIKKNL